MSSLGGAAEAMAEAAMATAVAEAVEVRLTPRLKRIEVMLKMIQESHSSAALQVAHREITVESGFPELDEFICWSANPFDQKELLHQQQQQHPANQMAQHMQMHPHMQQQMQQKQMPPQQMQTLQQMQGQQMQQLQQMQGQQMHPQTLMQMPGPQMQHQHSQLETYRHVQNLYVPPRAPSTPAGGAQYGQARADRLVASAGPPGPDGAPPSSPREGKMKVASKPHNRLTRMKVPSRTEVIGDEHWMEIVYKRVMQVIHKKEPVRSGFIQDIVLNPHFDRLSFIAIVLNTVYFIHMTNYSAKNKTTEMMNWMYFADTGFLMAYSTELAMKLWTHRFYFFIGEEFAWNMFDFMIVTFSFLEIIFSSIESMALDVMLSRVYRVFRVARILRVFRAFRFLSELRLMVRCLLGSLVSLFWCSVLLVLILAIASLVFVQILTELRIDNPDLCNANNGELEGQIMYHFGSVEKSMLALFKGATGGLDWGHLFDVVKHTGIFGGMLFVAYIVFFIFAFFNIITSIFVDRAMGFAKPDHETLVLEKRRADQKLAEELTEVIRQLDKDGGGVISHEEMLSLAERPEVRTCFEMAGLNISDVDSFFNDVCKVSGSTVIDIDSFVDSCMLMKGVATSVDMQTMLFRMQDMFNMVEMLFENLGVRQNITNDLRFCRQSHDGGLGIDSPGVGTPAAHTSAEMVGVGEPTW